MTHSDKKQRCIYKIVNAYNNMIYFGVSSNTDLYDTFVSIQVLAYQHPDKSSNLIRHMRALHPDMFRIESIKEYESISKKRIVKHMFKIMSEYNPFIVLNTITVYEKHLAKVKATKRLVLRQYFADLKKVEVQRLIDLHIEYCRKKPGMTRGLISHKAARTKNPECIMFAWTDHSGIKGKPIQRTWQISRWGMDEALRLAKQLQDTMYPIITL